MRARFALLLLLGTFFLASVCVSLEEKPRLHKCLESCKSEKDPYKRQVCQDRCKLVPEREEQHEQKHEEKEETEHPKPGPRQEERGQRERGRQEGEKAEEKREEEWRGRQRHEDPEERERVRQREEKRREREKEKREQREEDEKFRRREKKEQRQEREEGQGWESETHNNPFHFSFKRFHTLFKNQHAHIRVLQRFDQRSRQLENLRDYCLLEFKFKPNTLLLPHHADADFLLVILSGRAIVTILNSDDRDSYNLERGDAQRIPAGTTYYLVNPDDTETLRLVSLAIPVNYPGRFESFFLSSTEDQQSYLEGFSKDILEASFDAKFKEINRVLFGEEGQRQEKGVIVKVSNEHIRELSRHAKSSSRRTTSSQDEPFNLRSRNPIYSNKYGKLFEITPEKNLQLRHLDIFLSSLDINQASLMLPHYNSKATLILVVNKGEANTELVGLKQQQQEQETRQVRRYRAEVSEDDILIIPSGYPIAVNATSNLNLLVFGINAENNQRNFLAGEKDNVLRQMHRQVMDLAFPGSAEDVGKLIQNRRESYFVNAQPQREQEGIEERKGPLSSILNAF